MKGGVRSARKPARRLKKSPQKAQGSPARRAASEPNLIITIDERHRRLAGREVGALLERAGLERYELTKAPGRGLLGLRVMDVDPKACIRMLRAVFLDDPIAFQHTHRWMPIEAWARAESRELAEFARRAEGAIGPGETWRIRLEKHGSPLDRALVVNSMARGINNPHVNLEAADKTVLVELVGDRAGMAVVEADHVLSVDRAMAEEFVRFEEVTKSSTRR